MRHASKLAAARSRLGQDAARRTDSLADAFDLEAGGLGGDVDIGRVRGQPRGANASRGIDPRRAAACLRHIWHRRTRRSRRCDCSTGSPSASRRRASIIDARDRTPRLPERTTLSVAPNATAETIASPEDQSMSTVWHCSSSAHVRLVPPGSTTPLQSLSLPSHDSLLGWHPHTLAPPGTGVHAHPGTHPASVTHICVQTPRVSPPSGAPVSGTQVPLSHSADAPCRYPYDRPHRGDRSPRPKRDGGAARGRPRAGRPWSGQELAGDASARLRSPADRRSARGARHRDGRSRARTPARLELACTKREAWQSWTRVRAGALRRT